ncbi:low choriolytic enzyme-like [Pholidichthys leucotaenia]
MDLTPTTSLLLLLLGLCNLHYGHSHQADQEIPESPEDGMTSIILKANNDSTDRDKIYEAMSAFDHKTCIRFIPRSNERFYLTIEPKFGCFSLVGYIGDRQLLSLQRPCLKNSIIQHELLHAMGFFHEHSRSDRDQHIKVNWENIIEGHEHYFEKEDTENLGTPYDYGSVMQYESTAFAKNGKPTLTPIPDPSVPIGKAEGLSNIDVLRINKLYKCRNYLG